MVRVRVDEINKHSRFDAQNVANSPCLIPVLLVGLANGIDVVYSQDPLVLLQLDIAAKVMQMPD